MLTVPLPALSAYPSVRVPELQIEAHLASIFRPGLPASLLPHLGPSRVSIQLVYRPPLQSPPLAASYPPATVPHSCKRLVEIRIGASSSPASGQLGGRRFGSRPVGPARGPNSLSTKDDERRLVVSLVGHIECRRHTIHHAEVSSRFAVGSYQRVP